MIAVSELFLAGVLVTAVGCVIKVFKMFISNCRQIDCCGMTVYNSTMYEGFINRITSASNASTNSLLRGVNPMQPTPLLNTAV